MFCYSVFRFAAWLVTSAHAQFYLRNCKQQLPQQKTASLRKHPYVANCQPQPLCSSLPPSMCCETFLHSVRPLPEPSCLGAKSSSEGCKQTFLREPACSSCQLDPSDEAPAAPMKIRFWVMYVYVKNVHIFVCCDFCCRAVYSFLLKLIWVMWCLVHAAQPRPPICTWP